MQEPKISRPVFPPGYVDQPKAQVSWEYVAQRLADAKNYWLCSVRPNARPHAVPRWGVFVDGKLYYDGSPETRHARNLAANPFVTMHLESGDQAIIAEGDAREAGRPAKELAQRIAAAYRSKYASFGYAPEPDQWDEGGLYIFTPHKILAWTSFAEDPTKFTFSA